MVIGLMRKRCQLINVDVDVDGKRNLGPTDPTGQSGQSGQSEVVLFSGNFPVGPNRTRPFHLTSNRNFRKFWINGKHPK